MEEESETAGRWQAPDAKLWLNGVPPTVKGCTFQAFVIASRLDACVFKEARYTLCSQKISLVHPFQIAKREEGFYLATIFVSLSKSTCQIFSGKDLSRKGYARNASTWYREAFCRRYNLCNFLDWFLSDFDFYLFLASQCLFTRFTWIIKHIIKH